MHAAPIDLTVLAARAATLDERLAGVVVPDQEPDPQLVERRLAAWRKAVGGAEALERRLAWDGLSLESARLALGAARWPHGAALPSWCGLLAEALRVPPDATAGLGEGSPLPFEEIVAPFVVVGRDRLQARAAAVAPPISDTARKQLERSLLAIVSEIAAPTLIHAFARYTAVRRRPFRRLVALSTAPASRTLYDEFVARMRGGGLSQLLARSARLARSLATASEQWIEAVAELLERLAADWQALAAGLARGATTVVAIRSGLSDPHNGGRTVAALELDTGGRLVYKPRDLAPDAGFAALAGWLNDRGASPRLHAPAVLQRRGYGWVAWVEHRPLQDARELQRYFERAGVLLAVLHVLEATDMHSENVVANATGPVPVDLETLLHPRFADGDEGGAEAETLAEKRLADSALAVGLLPVWELSADRRLAYEHAGLEGVGGQEVPLPVRRWEGVNTDEMHLRYTRGRSDQDENAALLDGTRARAIDHEDDIVKGYRHGYTLVMENRRELAARDGPVERLGDRVRCIFRSTIDYGALLEDACLPRHSIEGVDRSLRLERLGASLMGSAPAGPGNAPPVRWPLIAAERQALERGDVPLFSVSPRGTTVGADDVALADCFETSALARVRRRLAALSRSDLGRQTELIRGALRAYASHEVEARSDPRPRARLSRAMGLCGDEALREAVALAEDLAARVIVGPNGTATWIGVQFIPRANRYELEPVSYGLYDGALGIGLFFAALARVSGDSRWAELAQLAVGSWRAALADPAARPKLLDTVGIGGGVGVGSFLYAGTRLARLLDAPHLIDETAAVADSMSPAAITADVDLDVLGGAAGAVLGLLALHSAHPAQPVLDAAIACGRRLLETRLPGPTGARAWPTWDGKLLAGFSHGAAGIAYALVGLAERAHDRAFLDAADEAIEYEASIYSRRHENWHDLRLSANAGGGFTARWCHGAPGVALARLGVSEALGDARVERDLEAGLRTTLAYGAGLAEVDHLCCGNFGRADVLLTAGRALARRDLVSAAERLVGATVRRARARGGYALGAGNSAGTCPGLFTGTAGIGYQLLRTVAPEVVPSVLAFE